MNSWGIPMYLIIGARVDLSKTLNIPPLLMPDLYIYSLFAAFYKSIMITKAIKAD